MVQENNKVVAQPENNRKKTNCVSSKAEANFVLAHSAIVFLLTFSSSGRRISASFFTSLRPRAEENATLTILKQSLNRSERSKLAKECWPRREKLAGSRSVWCYDRTSRDARGTNSTSG